MKLSPKDIISCFPAYKPDGLTSAKMISNLNDKLNDIQFCTDVEPMVRADSPTYDAHLAGQMIIEELLSHL